MSKPATRRSNAKATAVQHVRLNMRSGVQENTDTRPHSSTYSIKFVRTMFPSNTLITCSLPAIALAAVATAVADGHGDDGEAFLEGLVIGSAVCLDMRKYHSQ